MSRTVTATTSDSAAAAAAVALLDAADTLDVPVDRIKTVTSGPRVAFSAPTAVYTESGLTGGTSAPDDQDDGGAGGSGWTGEITAMITSVYLGVDEASGDSMGWNASVRIPEGPEPPRDVVLKFGGQEFQMRTGAIYTDFINYNNTGVMVRLTDVVSGNYDQHEYVQSDDPGTGTYTVAVD